MGFTNKIKYLTFGDSEGSKAINRNLISQLSLYQYKSNIKSHYYYHYYFGSCVGWTIVIVGWTIVIVFFTNSLVSFCSCFGLC